MFESLSLLFLCESFLLDKLKISLDFEFSNLQSDSIYDGCAKDEKQNYKNIVFTLKTIILISIRNYYVSIFKNIIFFNILSGFPKTKFKIGSNFRF